MSTGIPQGITPPAPNLDREEPELAEEADIPADDGGARPGSREGGEERPARERERE